MNLDFLGKAVDWMRIESAYGPSIFIAKPLGTGAAPGAPAAPGGPGGPAPGEIVVPSAPSLSKILRPKLTVGVRGLDSPIVYAPYGEPGETKWPIVASIGAGATVALVGFAAYGIYRLLKG